MSWPANVLRDDTTEVLQVLMRYLEGCHYGDLEKLRSAVATSTARPHSERTNQAAWHVPVSPSPADQGEPFGYQILNIDVDGDQAVATVSRVPQTDSLEVVAIVRAAGAWYVDANCVSEAECGS